MDEKQKMLMQELKRSFVVKNSNGICNLEENNLQRKCQPHKENTTVTRKTAQEMSEDKFRTKDIFEQIKKNKSQHGSAFPVYTNELQTQYPVMSQNNVPFQRQGSLRKSLEPLVRNSVKRSVSLRKSCVPLPVSTHKLSNGKTEKDDEITCIELRRTFGIKPDQDQSHFKRDTLKSSAFAVIKKVKGKLKYDNDHEFKNYLPPEININEAEHHRALEDFHGFRQHNMDMEKEGHHFRMASYTAYQFTIDNYCTKKMESRLGHFDYLLSDPLKIFNDHLQLVVHLNKKSRLSVGFCPTNTGVDIDLSLFVYHRRTLRINNSVTFVDEPPYGPQWVQKWIQEAYLEPKDVSHDLIERNSKDGCLFIQLIFEPLLPLVKFYLSNDGRLNWAVENYSQKYQDERNGVCQCVYSPYFYSSVRGYRMRVRLYLNGTGVTQGTHVAIFLDFLAGEWDAHLPPLVQFPHTTTFEIMDQSDLPKKEPIVRTETNRDGHPVDFFYDFATQSKIRDDIYLKKDTLHLRISVEQII